MKFFNRSYLATSIFIVRFTIRFYVYERVALRSKLTNQPSFISSVQQLPTEWNETMIRQVVLALTQNMSQLTLSKLCNISQVSMRLEVIFF